ncbi:Uncharacterised protein [Mycobacteroides abscessus subsp. massiliense]|uniref:hypothetical protein n=1 Tax=Mycobacteroides abscessus TaxID=36809 RepID=UPI0009A63392|nr:hypothetical protein [Mycobacteroides abscessus]SKY24349.1 Uncharacterised protein [Mycobacteroides abscessus subsp. massiliense]SKY66019.1 Uncharacterised protein [Mycobacteroides abscessus subsp. massiliense]
MSRQVQISFLRLPQVIAAVRETAETVRAYGLGPSGNDYGIARSVPRTLHMIAAELETEWRCWMTRHLAHKLGARDPALFNDDELRAGVWTLEPTNITPASYVIYPEPDLATRAQKLSGAAENLRILAVALYDALEVPATEGLCGDLRHVAERINTFAGVLADNNTIT